MFSHIEILTGSIIGASIGAIIGCTITYLSWSKLQQESEFIIVKKISKIDELKAKIKQLEEENTELRYRPGGTGYHEAYEEFANLAGKKIE